MTGSHSVLLTQRVFRTS